jgi:hypothetical protein
MNRHGRVIVFTAVALALLLSLGWFLHQNEISREHYTHWSDRAQRERWLALQQLADKLGASLVVQHRYGEPSGDTLVLLDGRMRFSASQQEQLERWVRGGGHLVALPFDGEAPSDADASRRSDPLLERTGVRLERAGKGTFGEHHRAGDTATITLPDGILRVGSGALGTHRLIDGAGAGIWRAAEKDRLVALRVPLGRGRITWVQHLWFASNASLDRHDHALLAVAVLDLGRGARVQLALQGERTGLYAWLALHAPAPLIALALLLVLWVWSRIPRLGPIAADPPQGRRSLAEHIRASGRVLAAAGVWAPLFEACRTAFDKRLVLRLPGAGDLRHEDLVEALCTRTGLAAQTVRTALDRTPPDSGARLAAQVHAIETVLRRL